MTPDIPSARIRSLNRRGPVPGRYVLYWMQQSQRAQDNHALEYAVASANQLGTGVVVGLGLTASYPEANLRAYRFMLEGLRETADQLRRRNIPLVIRLGSPDRVALELAQQAALVVCDRGYLRHQKRWRSRVAAAASCPVIQVESDVVVPVDVVSLKREYAARTIRPRIHRHLDDFLVPVPTVPLRRRLAGPALPSLSLANLDAVLRDLPIDRSVPPVSHLFPGGSSVAHRFLERFFESQLEAYAAGRRRPEVDQGSHLGMYLHFGQISPLGILLRLRQLTAAQGAGARAFLEELVVRRELAINFVEHTPAYDRYRSLPGWARRTLREHGTDPRPAIHTLRQLETARTRDPYWNAAMRELRYTGYLPNAMRMYWGKRFLTWTRRPRTAFRFLLTLNNRYFLDGRDPNSFANVGWVFGLHDRPWPQHPVFGSVRSMTAAGLERKADMRGYLSRVDRLVAEARRQGVHLEDDG